MNKIEKMEIKNSITKLQERNNELKGMIKAENDVAVAEGLVKEIQDNAQKLVDLTGQLSAEADKSNEEKDGDEPKMNYLKSDNSVKEFFDLMKNTPKKGFVEAWNEKLKDNAITITDTSLQLPRKIVESIQTSLLETNPVFKVFRVTHVGALIVSSIFDSADEANVHVPGSPKVEQSAVLDTSTIKPVMVYKLQTISEYVKRLNVDYSELYNMVVAELTQAIVNKVVDLALKEGLANGTNGFISLEAESAISGGSKKVKAITAVSGKLVEAVEEAVDFVRPRSGRRYLIVTAEQRKALLDELRTIQPTIRLKNDDKEIASELGVDEIIVYTGTKAIKATLVVQDAYHIDMQDITKVDAFEYKTNENAILIEALCGGHAEALNGGAVITFP